MLTTNFKHKVIVKNVDGKTNSNFLPRRPWDATADDSDLVFFKQ